MMICPSLDDELINEIKYSLPSQNIAGFATIIVIRHPNSDDLIVLKWRLPWHETDALKEPDFEELADRRTWGADWSDLIGKHIIVNPNVLHERGRKALELLAETI